MGHTIYYAVLACDNDYDTSYFVEFNWDTGQKRERYQYKDLISEVS
jgi:hypothetical protein